MWESEAQGGVSLLYMSQFHNPTFEVLTSSDTYITSRTNYTIPKSAKLISDRFSARRERKKKKYTE